MFCLFRWLRTFNIKSTLLNKKRRVAKTWSVEDLIVENTPFQVDVRGKREIHSVPWSYIFNLVSNVNTMLDNLHRFGLQFIAIFSNIRMQNIAFRGQFMASAQSWGICQKTSSNSDALNWVKCVKTDVCGHSQAHK